VLARSASAARRGPAAAHCVRGRHSMNCSPAGCGNGAR
jgi:hypothetical protein